MAFWKLIEDPLRVPLPSYVKKMLESNGFDNIMSFRSINEKILDEVELFARETLRDSLGKGADLKSYYGPHYETPEKFTFSTDDRALILDCVEYVHEKCRQND